MARILLATFGSLGDLYPYLAIGLELKACGHEVTIAAQSFYSEYIAAEGLRFHHVGPDVDPADQFTKPDAFLRNATEKIVKGIEQLLRYDDAVRILAINVQSPDGIFIDDIGIELQQIVRNKSRGSVGCVLLHHHHFLEV